MGEAEPEKQEQILRTSPKAAMPIESSLKTTNQCLEDEPSKNCLKDIKNPLDIFENDSQKKNENQLNFRFEILLQYFFRLEKDAAS